MSFLLNMKPTIGLKDKYIDAVEAASFCYPLLGGFKCVAPRADEEIFPEELKKMIDNGVKLFKASDFYTGKRWRDAHWHYEAIYVKEPGYKPTEDKQPYKHWLKLNKPSMIALWDREYGYLYDSIPKEGCPFEYAEQLQLAYGVKVRDYWFRNNYMAPAYGRLIQTDSATKPYFPCRRVVCTTRQVVEGSIVHEHAHFVILSQ